MGDPYSVGEIVSVVAAVINNGKSYVFSHGII